ncbi:MAG: hypothetical protein HY923_04130 [Elusimicrobia bacterium]|nr:hypothetical protein [Elusimicrobiota bacterium]
MNRKASLTAAALAALAMSGCGGASHHHDDAAKTDAGKTGECWGVNECKGKGACGGVGHECAGGNTCKGKGWLTLTKPECDAKKGKFKAG